MPRSVQGKGMSEKGLAGPACLSQKRRVAYTFKTASTYATYTQKLLHTRAICEHMRTGRTNESVPTCLPRPCLPKPGCQSP